MARPHLFFIDMAREIALLCTIITMTLLSGAVQMGRTQITFFVLNLKGRKRFFNPNYAQIATQ